MRYLAVLSFRFAKPSSVVLFRRKMIGSTLVSLMIGMLVSMIGVLACMSLYKTLIDVSVDAKTDALHDGQLSFTFLAVQLRVQNAGFGIDPSATNIVTAEVNNVKTLMWRYKVGATTICEGISRRPFDDNGRQKLAIDYVRVNNSACNVIAALGTLNWVRTSTLAVFDTVVLQSIDFNVQAGSCYPYRMGTSGNHYILTLSGKTAANLHGAQIGGNPMPDTEISLCLHNMTS